MGVDQQAQRDEHRRISHHQVVDTARSLVAREGPSALVMRRLSHALGVSLPTLYVAIGSKDQLVVDLVRSATTSLFADGVRDGGGPVAHPFEAFQRALAWLDCHPWFAELMESTTAAQLAAAYRNIDDDDVLSVSLDQLAATCGDTVTGGEHRGVLLHGFMRALLLADELADMATSSASLPRVQLAVDVFAALRDATRPAAIPV